MGGEGHLHSVVDVEPLRVVVHLVGLDRHSGHPTEGRVEVLKHKLLLDGVPPLTGVKSGFILARLPRLVRQLIYEVNLLKGVRMVSPIASGVHFEDLFISRGAQKTTTCCLLITKNAKLNNE